LLEPEISRCLEPGEEAVGQVHEALRGLPVLPPVIGCSFSSQRSRRRRAMCRAASILCSRIWAAECLAQPTDGGVQLDQRFVEVALKKAGAFPAQAPPHAVLLAGEEIAQSACSISAVARRVLLLRHGGGEGLESDRF
jgi:hypothetical protein